MEKAPEVFPESIIISEEKLNILTDDPSSSTAFVIGFPPSSVVPVEIKKEDEDQEEVILEEIEKCEEITFTDLDNGTVTKVEEVETTENGKETEAELLTPTEITTPGIKTYLQKIQSKMLTGDNGGNHNLRKKIVQVIKKEPKGTTPVMGAVVAPKEVELEAKPMRFTLPKRTYGGRRKSPDPACPLEADEPQQCNVKSDSDVLTLENTQITIMPTHPVLIPGKKKPPMELSRKRKLIVDSHRQISNNEFKRQLTDTEDILTPRPKKVFKQKNPLPKTVNIGSYFIAPGRAIPNGTLSRLYANKLVIKVERDDPDKKLVPLSVTSLRLDTECSPGRKKSKKDSSPERELVHIGNLPEGKTEKAFKPRTLSREGIREVIKSVDELSSKFLQTGQTIKTYSRKKRDPGQEKTIKIEVNNELPIPNADPLFPSENGISLNNCEDSSPQIKQIKTYGSIKKVEPILLSDQIKTEVVE